MINENIVEDAAKAAFVKAQSVYRGDHDHFPLTYTWETTTERIREGWRSIAYAALEAADTPPLGTQPEPRVSGRQMNRCHVCGGEGRIYECWDEKTCPMAQDGGCDDCARRCPECHGSRAARDSKA